jgi:uncharacterized repeat protein (TIGR02543 family)
LHPALQQNIQAYKTGEKIGGKEMKNSLKRLISVLCIVFMLIPMVMINAGAEPALITKGYNMTVNVGSGSTLRFCSTTSTADAYEIGSIPNGATVYVYGITTQQYENRTWAKINYNSRDGWVNYAWLSDPGPAVATVAYNANGGSGAPASTQVTASNGVASFYLSTVLPTRSGYDFVGWRLENSTSYGIDSPGQHISISVTSSCVLTYYAQWKTASRQTATVTYNSNGGSGAPSSMTVEVVGGESKFQLSSTRPVRSGYTFSGWRLGNVSSNPLRAPGEYVTITNVSASGTIPFYAVWTSSSSAKQTVTIAYNSNGGSGAPSSSAAEISNGSASFYLSGSTPTRSGYTFTGWKLQNNSTAPLLSPGQYVTENNVTASATLTYYAQWKTSQTSGLSNFKQKYQYNNNFRDVSSTAWYYKNVAAAYNYGLMVGNSSTIFNVNGNLSVAEAITMACRLHSIYYTGSDNFTRTGSTWYQVYVDYAAENGITTHSYSSYTRAVTRAEYAELFANAFPSEALSPINTINDGAIPDVPASSQYAGEIYKLYRAGVLSGSDKYGTFRPNSSILRVEAAAIVTRMADTSLRQRYVLEVNKTLLGTVSTLSGDKVEFKNTAGCLEDNYGNTYDNCYSLNGTDFFVSEQNAVVYNIKGKYTHISGTAVISQRNKTIENNGWVKIYGDNQLLYDSGTMKPGDAPKNFSLDLSSYSQLKIEEYQYYGQKDSYTFLWCEPYLVNLYVW